MEKVFGVHKEMNEEDRQANKALKNNINSAINKCTPVEMEHVEFYFTPKEKYVGAFEALQKLFELIKAIRYKKIHINHNFDGGMFVENEDFFQAINIFTGELDLKRFLICMHDVIKKKHIYRYVSDEALQAELLEALKRHTKWESDLNNPDYYNSDFLSSVFINTIDKMNLTDYIMDDQGIVKLVVNIMQLGNDGYVEHLGIVLGTLADKITRIVYVDGRDAARVYDSLNTDRVYKVLGFDYLNYNDLNGNDLIIKDIRVPDYDACEWWGINENEISEEFIYTTEISIPLVDKATKYHIKIRVDLKEECIQPLSSIFELTHILEKAFREKKIKPMSDSGDYTHTINSIVFDTMLCNFNITQLTIINMPILFWLFNYNRDYVLREIFENVDNPDLKAGVLKSIEGNDYKDILSVGTDNIDIIYENNIRDGQWIFEADYKSVLYSELETLFDKIIDNIGKEDCEEYEITQL